MEPPPSVVNDASAIADDPKPRGVRQIPSGDRQVALGDTGPESDLLRLSAKPHPQRNTATPKHPVWRCFSKPTVRQEHIQEAHRKTLSQLRVLVTCEFCGVELERDTAMSKDLDPASEIDAMRDILYDMVRHLLDSCTRCPKDLRDEMAGWPTVPIPLGGDHKKHPPVKAPPGPRVGSHSTATASSPP